MTSNEFILLLAAIRIKKFHHSVSILLNLLFFTVYIHSLPVTRYALLYHDSSRRARISKYLPPARGLSSLSASLLALEHGEGFECVALVN